MLGPDIEIREVVEVGTATEGTGIGFCVGDDFLHSCLYLNLAGQFGHFCRGTCATGIVGFGTDCVDTSAPINLSFLGTYSACKTKSSLFLMFVNE